MKSVSDSALDDLFHTAIVLVRQTPDSKETQTSNEEKLRLYGLYKHVTDGPCPDDQQPSIILVVSRSKYQAWQACKTLARDKAMMEYIEILASRKDELGYRCQSLLEKFHSERSEPEENDKSAESVNLEDAEATEKFETSQNEGSDKSIDDLEFSRQGNKLNLDPTSLRLLLASWTNYLLKLAGVRPLIPRGRLDISYRDLFFALFQCFRSKQSAHRCQELSSQISRVWKDAAGQEAVVGLSVRSLFDLYLSIKDYPSESEVVIFPPINVPGMMYVANYHGLNIAPVDIGESEWWNLKGIQESITARTVAIMVVHPFGMLSTSPQQLKELRILADKHGLELWEDCAECFTGLGTNCYLGDAAADVRLFSFGMIKTSTALGGGVAIFRDAKLAKKVDRLQESCYKRQYTYEFFRRILLSIVLNFTADSPMRVGLLAAICAAFGLPFDDVVARAIRTFQLDNSNEKKSEARERIIQKNLVRQIQKQPSLALLSLLLRRFQQSISSAPALADRIKRCQRMESILRSALPDVLIPNAPDTLNTYWCFPISCQHRDLVSKEANKFGFDVVSGASQLMCVSSFTSDENEQRCPRAKSLMRSILYLPVSSQNLLERDLVALADSIRHSRQVIDVQYPEGGACLKCQSGHQSSQRLYVMVRIAAFILMILGGIVGLNSLFRGLAGLVLTTSGTLVTGYLLVCLMLYALRWSMASLYLNKLSSFAENCDMIDAATVHGPLGATSSQNQSILSKIGPLRIPSRRGEAVRLDAKAILTGATGFVGSLLLKDLLLHRDSLSLNGGVIVICRRKQGESAKSRMEKILAQPMFSFLSKSEKNKLVDVVEGDVTERLAGLSQPDLSRICDDQCISHVFHCAAAVSFTQDLPEAARSNITSSLTMKSLTDQLQNCDARFVHISTAFVHGDQCGSSTSPLQEELFPMTPFDPAEIYKSMLGTQFYATKAMLELRFHNSYTFSKCVCEHLLLKQNRGNIVIVRPSIVGPAVESPFEGWAGSKPSTIVGGACLHLSNQWNLWHLTAQYVACIPVDVLSRVILAKAFQEVCCPDEGNETASSSDSFEKVSRFSDTSSDAEEVALATTARPNEKSSQQLIFNATWDATTGAEYMFSWLDFVLAYLQMGCIVGYFNRSNAYLTLLVSAKLMPLIATTGQSYDKLHTLLIRTPIAAMINLFERVGCPAEKLKRLLSFIDLPLLFFPFMKSTFYFQSDLVTPDCFNAKRYSLSCGVAAHRFISGSNTKEKSDVCTKQKMRTVAVGGRAHTTLVSDLWWVLSQPQGDFLVRVTAFLFIKVLRVVCSVVTVDLTSFRKTTSSVKLQKDGPTYLVLAPTHRSVFDFVLLSYVIFALPELQLDIPVIIAADEFRHLPVVGWLARLLRAFYIQRGRGFQDPSLISNLRSMKANRLSAAGACLEVFVEGTRSRDRRFVNPKTGFLQSLSGSGGKHVVVPITLNYERLPEQNQLSEEAGGTSRGSLSVSGMLRWLRDVWCGRVNIGKIHIAANDPLSMACRSKADFKEFVNEIQRQQQRGVYVSDYHVQAASRLCSIDPIHMEKAITTLGCRRWPQTPQCLFCPKPEMPEKKSDLCTIFLQVSHHLAPLFFSQRPKWSDWLNRSELHGDAQSLALDCHTQLIFNVLLGYFDAADSLVSEACRQLAENGFPRPKSYHVFQTAKSMDREAILPFVYAAVNMKISDIDESLSPASDLNVVLDCTLPDTREKLGFWGFHDSGFILQANRLGRQMVTMKGRRYNLGGRSLTKLLPFIENEMHIRLNPLQEFNTAPDAWSRGSPSKLSAEDQTFLRETFQRASFSTLDRTRHGTGHSQEDVYLIRSGGDMRVPDAVVWPSSEEEVETVVQVAREKNWCLIPFGGGTNVSNATRCPTEDVEKRPIISVDMKKMHRILWLNEEDGLAHVEAGITGRHLVEELERRGFTMGHEPDSIEFSTLGGWVATKASGMKRSKYGNIEDIVKATRVVGPDGLLWKGARNDKIVPGRVAEGLDVRSLVIGSEGCLGIITSAVIRIWSLPEVVEFDSVVLPSFKDGLQFARGVARLGGSAPASVRLLDNAHFRLGQALRPDETSIFCQLKAALLKVASSALWSFDHKSVVCATITFEGSKSEVKRQKRDIRELASAHGGVMLGPNVGKSGYELTYMIAYLRDFAMTYHLLGESFETFVPWSKIESLISATKERIVEEHKSRFLPGVPFVGCRVTQLYHEGVCLYFYLCISFDGVDRGTEAFSALENAARDEIVKQGGSLSHHHGIGKHRAPLLKGRASPEFDKAIALIKNSLDKDNVFGARNGPFATCFTESG